MRMPRTTPYGPRIVCSACERNEVPMLTPICATCTANFSLVDQQEPVLGSRQVEPESRLIQIGPTDIS